VPGLKVGRENEAGQGYRVGIDLCMSVRESVKVGGVGCAVSKHGAGAVGELAPTQLKNGDVAVLVELMNGYEADTGFWGKEDIV